MQEWWQRLTFSRAERNGIVVLACCMLFLLGFRLWLAYWQPALPQGDIALFRQEVADFEADTLLEINTATVGLLQELPGIGPSMAGHIVAYREQLGGFSYPEQLLDVPGIGEAKLDGLLPFIRIDTSLAKVHRTKPAIPPSENPTTVEDTLASWPIKLGPGETIDLNTATINDLRRLPGIGLAYAERIVQYRDLLGGFHSTHQLLEIGGIGQAKYAAMEKHLTINAKALQRIDINTATETQLLQHPYASGAWVAKVLEHRPFGHLDELPQEGFNPRILPYLTVGN